MPAKKHSTAYSRAPQTSVPAVIGLTTRAQIKLRNANLNIRLAQCRELSLIDQHFSDLNDEEILAELRRYFRKSF